MVAAAIRCSCFIDKSCSIIFYISTVDFEFSLCYHNHIRRHFSGSDYLRAMARHERAFRPDFHLLFYQLHKDEVCHKKKMQLLQMLDLKDWPERSLSYLARSYDNVAKGDEYINVKPVYHIGFLNHTLFPEYPEFFAKYRMMNLKNHNVYTSKFNLYVVDLTQTKQAGERK